MIARCLFEQSGTFKNEFIKLGITAFDYDILNDFNETDIEIDIFREINYCFNDIASIFDSFNKDDLLLAFFPCVRFENQINLHFRGDAYGVRNWCEKKKLINCMRLHDELNEYYHLITKLVLICIDRGLKLIIENPYSKEHYLSRYWCLKPDIIDYDRRLLGDYFKKPTQYWFINCKPKNNTITEKVTNNSINCKDAIRTMTKKDAANIGAKNVKIARSMISPDYANRFIREYIL